MSGLGINPYLADVYAAFAPGVAPASYTADPASLVSQAPVAPPLVGPSIDAAGPMIGPAAGPPPPAPLIGPPNEPPPRDPIGVLAPPPVPEPPPGPIGPPNIPEPAPPVDPLAFPLQAAATGGSPAQELDLRGPKMRTAQNIRNSAVEDAIGTVDERNQGDAQAAYDIALMQERDARARAAAIDQAAAEQEEEMQARQADFDATTRQISKLGQIDRGRMWASRSTAGKVAGVVEMMLAGLRNAPSMVSKAIDDDVRAQEFAYMAGRDTLNAKQTAFSMAMQKYQQAGAARAVARAAAIDVTQAQLAQHAATHQGTESANRATLAIADLQNEKLAQFQQAYRYMPAQGGGRRWVDPRTGLIYSEQEAKAMMAKREDWAQADRTEVAKLGGQMMIKGAETEAKRGENAVQLPNGQVVNAPSPKEAEALRGLAIAVENANQLVNQAKAIRSQTTWRADPEARAQLDRISSELTLAFKDRGGLGALSGPDMDLAVRATGDLKGFTGVDSVLDGFARTTNQALQNRVRTIPGSPDNARGMLSPEAQKSLGGYSKK